MTETEREWKAREIREEEVRQIWGTFFEQAANRPDAPWWLVATAVGLAVLAIWKEFS